MNYEKENGGRSYLLLPPFTYTKKEYAALIFTAFYHRH